MANPAMRNIGLYVSSRRDDLKDCIDRLCQFLDNKAVHYYFESNCYKQLAASCKQADHQTFDADNMVQPIDLIVVIGGDGSFLHACQLFHQYKVPLTGINLGRLGFLTDISINNLEELLDSILEGQGTIENRYFFQGKTTSRTDYALNDIVIQTPDSASIMDIEVKVDGSLAFDLRCDGIILASSTGSTAYGLSAGGPLLHPDVDALVLVPLAAHTLSARPCVIPSHKSLEIQQKSAVKARVSIDGTSRHSLDYGESIIISKSSWSITLAHPLGYDYFAACRSKLGWNARGY